MDVTSRTLNYLLKAPVGAIWLANNAGLPATVAFASQIAPTAMIIVSAITGWAMPTLQSQVVDFLAFVGWALPTIPYRLAARGRNDDQGPLLRKSGRLVTPNSP